jgi:hypothetical protein
MELVLEFDVVDIIWMVSSMLFALCVLLMKVVSIDIETQDKYF